MKRIILILLIILPMVAACSLKIGQSPLNKGLSNDVDKRTVAEGGGKLEESSNDREAPPGSATSNIISTSTNPPTNPVVNPSTDNGQNGHNPSGALELNDLKQCDLMDQMVGGQEVIDSYKDACYAMLAKNLKKIDVCYFIKEINYKRQCYNYFLNNVSGSNCSTIGELGAKNDCLTVTAVSGGPVNPNSGTFIDSRDQRTYKWVKIGDQTWLAENLAYDNGCSQKTWANRQDVGWCGYYENDKNKYASRGLLYQWSGAMAGSEKDGSQGICPAGWRMPSDEDFSKLETYLGVKSEDLNNIGWIDSGQVGKKLKAVSWGGTDDYGFSVIPSGFRYSDGTFNFITAGEFTHFWTSTLFNSNNSEEGGTTKDAWYRLISEDDGINRNFLGYSAALSIRCIKD